jgi:predicted transcriptional regulator
MTKVFTGKSISRSISLPDDLWAYLDRRAEKEDRPVSRIVRRDLESIIFGHCQRLVDSKERYEVK